MNVVALEFKSTEKIVLFGASEMMQLEWFEFSYLSYAIFVLHYQLYFSILQTLGNCFFSTSELFFLLLLRQIRPGGLISPEVSNTHCFWWSVTHIFKILKVKEKVAGCEFLWRYPVGYFVEWLFASAYLTQVTRFVFLEKGRVTPWLWDCQWNGFNASFL